MKEFLKKYWRYILMCIIGFIVGILINIPSCNPPEPEIKYIPVHDTITIKKDSIICKTKPVNVYFHDTIYINKSGDTIKLDDLPITEYKYQDTVKTDSTSTEIMINYHGFDAGIDSISLIHNYFSKQETIVKEPKRVGLVWAIGPSLGYSVTVNPMNGQMNHGFSAGVTLTLGIGGIIK